MLVRVGGSTPIHTDARVLAATNQNLAEMVRAKRFREDLYFRLNVVTLDLPPLRERPDDVLLLAEHFLGDFCQQGPPQDAAVHRRRPEAAAGAPLAGQRPRAAEPDGAAGLPLDRGPHRGRGPGVHPLAPRPGARWWPISTSRWPTPRPGSRPSTSAGRSSRAGGNMSRAADAAGPAPLEPLPQDAAAWDGDTRVDACP